jgi:hypothetical protein
MFETKFDSYVCEGDKIRCIVEGIEFTATIERDTDSHIDDDDAHNTDQSVTGCDDEQQSELLDARDQWLRDQWFYCGVVISGRKNGVEIGDNLASLWGIECNYPGSNNEYLTEVANELLGEAIVEAKRRIADMVGKLIG